MDALLPDVAVLDANCRGGWSRAKERPLILPMTDVTVPKTLPLFWKLSPHGILSLHSGSLLPGFPGLEGVNITGIHQRKSGVGNKREEMEAVLKWPRCLRDFGEHNEVWSAAKCERTRQTDKVLGQYRRHRQSGEWWGLGWFYFT